MVTSSKPVRRPSVGLNTATRAPPRPGNFCELGGFFCEEAEDFVKARRMYEHALSRVPDYPLALQGLADLHLHKGDTAQAVTFFARLATYWEETGDIEQAVACHLRLADIWQHRLGDHAACAARYKKVTELDPTCLHAVITLADLCRAAGQTEQALMHYQAVIAADTGSPQGAPTPAVHAYEQAIAILQQTGHGAQLASLQLAYLDRPHPIAARACRGHCHADGLFALPKNLRSLGASAHGRGL